MGSRHSALTFSTSPGSCQHHNSFYLNSVIVSHSDDPEMADNNPYQNVQDNVREAFDDLLADESVYLPQKEATELFNLPDVHIFFVSSSGKVSTFSEPSTLRIFKFNQPEDDGRCQTFIQVSGWTHPLIPGASPVFEAGNGAFMFPDAYGEDEGEAQVELAKLLDELTFSLKKEEVKENDANVNEHKLGPVGLTVFKGAKLLGKTVEQGADQGAKLIEYVADKQKAKIQVQEDRKDAKVNAALKTTVKGANYATKATVKVSGFVANRLGKLSKGLSNHLAKKMAPAPAMSDSNSGGGEGAKKPRSSSMYNLMDAARGGLLAYGTVYSSLEESAKVLGKSMKDESVQVIEKKYGGEAGQLHLEAMTAAGNAAMTYMNIQSCGAKGLVKRTAKDTGKKVGKALLEAHAKDSK